MLYSPLELHIVHECALTAVKFRTKIKLINIFIHPSTLTALPSKIMIMLLLFLLSAEVLWLTLF